MRLARCPPVVAASGSLKEGNLVKLSALSGDLLHNTIGDGLCPCHLTTQKQLNSAHGKWSLDARGLAWRAGTEATSSDEVYIRLTKGGAADDFPDHYAVRVAEDRWYWCCFLTDSVRADKVPLRIQ